VQPARVRFVGDGRSSPGAVARLEAARRPTNRLEWYVNRHVENSDEEDGENADEAALELSICLSKMVAHKNTHAKTHAKASLMYGRCVSLRGPAEGFSSPAGGGSPPRI